MSLWIWGGVHLTNDAFLHLTYHIFLMFFNASIQASKQKHLTWLQNADPPQTALLMNPIPVLVPHLQRKAQCRGVNNSEQECLIPAAVSPGSIKPPFWRFLGLCQSKTNSSCCKSLLMTKQSILWLERTADTKINEVITSERQEKAWRKKRCVHLSSDATVMSHCSVWLFSGYLENVTVWQNNKNKCWLKCCVRDAKNSKWKLVNLVILTLSFLCLLAICKMISTVAQLVVL